VTLNPPGQYADDRHLRAWQRFWLFQDPQFDIVNWVLDLAGPSPGMRVLDAGCGNGLYLRGLRDRRVTAVGCDLSPGMLRAAAHEAAGHLAAGHPAAGRPAVLNADVTALPLGDGAVDVALAIHMLYHVPDRPAALRELRRVTAPGGLVVAGGHPRRGRGRRLRGQPGHPPSGRDRPPLAGRRG
jgi:ubiquinone/menaquinone biosynthesis C-methylase UbiE